MPNLPQREIGQLMASQFMEGNRRDNAKTDSSATYAKEKDVVFKRYADIPFLTS